MILPYIFLLWIYAGAGPQLQGVYFTMQAAEDAQHEHGGSIEIKKVLSVNGPYWE